MVSPTAEQRLASTLLRRGVLLALAESCTGGLLAHRVTQIPGSSAYFDRGLVAYSNQAKEELLGVPRALIEGQGAVSEACARAMLDGLFERTPAHIGAAVTGIAGPTGGRPDKPVGTVWVAWGWRGSVSTERLWFPGGRSAVKEATAEAVLHRLAAAAQEPP